MFCVFKEIDHWGFERCCWIWALMGALNAEKTEDAPSTKCRKASTGYPVLVIDTKLTYKGHVLSAFYPTGIR